MVHQSPNTRFVASQKSDTGFQAALFFLIKHFNPQYFFYNESKTLAMLINGSRMILGFE